MKNQNKKVVQKKLGTTSKVNKTSSKVKTTSSKKTTVNAKTAKKSPATKVATKGKKASTKTSTTKKKKTVTKATRAELEYYDLPYRYNETVVKVLAQTPKSLFVYWDISDYDRENFVKKYGENFFNDTIPYLRIHNETKNTYFDVDVDDFANGWYVHIDDSKSTYSVSLFRKQRPYRNKIIEHEIYITNSNKIESPNDHILFEKTSPTVLYKNVKTNIVTKKTLPPTIYKNSRKEIYGLYEFYKEIYQNEDIDEVFNLNNPSSSNPTSTFK